MAHTYTLQFTHRLNDDGTIDSICRECFTTVATAKSGSALEREEQRHHCDGFLLRRYKKVQSSENFPGSLA
jgi:hypothetical protein